jgi:hypothetical protein
MAKKDRLTEAGVKVGTMLGRANRKAYKIVEARGIAKKELQALAKQVEELRRQLVKTTKRLKKAIS